MGAFRYTPPREADSRHRAARTTAAREASSREPEPSAVEIEIAAPLPQAIQPQRKLRNIVPVLTLDEATYITFNRRLYKIPPIPFKLGQRLLDLHVSVVTEMKALALYGKAADTKSYYKHLAILSRLMWSHMIPVPRWRRVLRRCWMLRNPLRRASEQDLLRLTDFFLKCRMKSSVHSMSDPELTPLNEIPMLSTSSRSS